MCALVTGVQTVALPISAPAPAGKELQLEPGQEMIASVGAGAPPTLVSFDPERSSSWEAGQLSFGDEPLALAVVRMNRYSSRKLALRSEGRRLGQEGVRTGRFRW